MNEQKLKSFVVLARAKNFTAAAKILNTTQSNISKHILALEKELNVKLLERSNKNVVLTEDGEFVLYRAKIIVEEYEKLYRDLSLKTNSLTIGCIPVMPHYELYKLINKFQDSYPEIKVILSEVEDHDIIEQMRFNSMNLVICRRNDTYGNEFKTLNLYKDKLVVIVPKSHKFSKNKSISLTQIKDEIFLQVSEFSTMGTITLKACKNAGFEPNIQYKSDHIENLITMVSEGKGVTLLMEKVGVYYKNSNVKIIPLTDIVTSDVVLGYDKKLGLSENAGLFWDFARKWRREN